MMNFKGYLFLDLLYLRKSLLYFLISVVPILVICNVSLFNFLPYELSSSMFFALVLSVIIQWYLNFIFFKTPNKEIYKSVLVLCDKNIVSLLSKILVAVCVSVIYLLISYLALSLSNNDIGENILFVSLTSLGLTCMWTLIMNFAQCVFDNMLKISIFKYIHILLSIIIVICFLVFNLTLLQIALCMLFLLCMLAIINIFMMKKICKLNLF